MEDIPPGLEENLAPEVDHRQVPVGVPHDVLQGPLTAGQKGPEQSPHPGLVGLTTARVNAQCWAIFYFVSKALGRSHL